MQIDSLIFDMDGTLWDGVETYANGINDFAKEQGIDRSFTDEDLYQYMGMEEAQYLAAIMPTYTPEQRKEMYSKIVEHQYKRIMADGGELFDGVREGLHELANHYKLFIVSNCPEFTIDYFTRWAKIEHLFTETLSHGKNHLPKHKNIQLLIEKHNLQYPFYIGDTESDRQQSTLAGIPYAHVTYGFGESDDSLYQFDTFTQLTNFFLYFK